MAVMQIFQDFHKSMFKWIEIILKKVLIRTLVLEYVVNHTSETFRQEKNISWALHYSLWAFFDILYIYHEHQN